MLQTSILYNLSFRKSKLNLIQQPSEVAFINEIMGIAFLVFAETEKEEKIIGGT